MIGLYIALGVVAVFIIYLVCLYNSLVKSRNNAEEAFSTMDVYLKKRWDIVPNLVEVVKGYTKHEKETLKEIVELRNLSYGTMSSQEKIQANNKLSQSLGKLLAVAEAYPQLKSDQNYIQLNEQLFGLEDEIANSRKYYNGSVKALNNKIDVFPNNIFSKMFKFEKMSMYEALAKERENVIVKF